MCGSIARKLPFLRRDAPLLDELARALTAAMAAKPKPKETISII
jgi:hypothetical protein